jgi:outer membrane protein assembly factor BamA
MRQPAVYLLLLMLLSGCTSLVPRETLFYPLANGESDRQVKIVTVPVPVIAATPNEGVTTGALAAFLVHNRRDEVTSLVAPQVNFNPNFGMTYTLYGAFYPERSRSVEVNLSRSVRVNDDYEAKIRDATLLAGRLEINAFLYHFTDGSSRFFGLGPGSQLRDETNYGGRENGFALTAAYPLYRHTALQLGERLRQMAITRGAISGLPFSGDYFREAAVPGMEGTTTNAQRIGLVYSTLDSTTMPTFGGYARAVAEVSARQLGSDTGFRRYEADAKAFMPLDPGRRFITAARIAYSQSEGAAVPFFEQSSLGGETTLRGYGRNRFIDKTALLFSLEERIRLLRWVVFDVTADWELATFIDAGAVAGSAGRLRGDNFRFTPGVGIRAVVRPNIVGRLDIGWGGEGAAVFVGLGYPF